MASAESVGVGVGINSIVGAGVIGNWIFRLLSAAVALRKHCTCNVYLCILPIILYYIRRRRRQSLYIIEITFILQ